MNRFLIYAGGLFLATAIICGALLLRQIFSMPTTSQGNIPSGSFQDNTGTATQSAQQAIRSLFQTTIDHDDPDHVTLGQTVIVAGYALQLWSGDNTGGEGLLRYDVAKSQWVVITDGGGAWSVDGLVGFGVLRNTAESLLGQIAH